MKTIYTLLAVFLLHFCGKSQNDSIYTSAYLSKSTKFAATTIGADILCLSGGTTSFIQNGNVKEVDFSTTFLPRLSIGGVHFWGHAEFYVNFPLPFLAIQRKPNELDVLKYTQGIDAGFKVYPIPLKINKISPYVGLGFRLLNFQQQQKGEQYSYKTPQFQKTIYPIQLGLTYTAKKYLFSLNSQYQQLQSFSYYTNPSTIGTVKVKPYSFQLSVLAYFDSDKHLSRKEFVTNENNKYKILKKNNKLSSWYWAFGPSASLQISKSPFLFKFYPQLYNEFIGGFTPDVTFGRYFNKVDGNIGFSYRTFGNTMQGFNDKISVRRHSFMLESYKNLFNYYGFVPFVGVTGSIENLNVRVNGNRFTNTKPALGFIFGWDIRVTKTGTSLLRTNLRYIPDLHIKINNEKLMFDQLEFNFIQWVQFIGRNNLYKKYRK